MLDIDDSALARRLIWSDLKTTTRLAKTPGDGLHVYVQEQRGHSRSGPLVPGVADLKAEGGYVVAPPSLGYELLSDVAPLRVANAGKWAINFLQANGMQAGSPQIGQQEVRAYETLKHRPLHEGERDSTLTSVAGLFWQKGFDGQVIEAALVGVNDKLCDPPLPARAVEKIILSVGRYPRNPTTSQPIYTSGDVEITPLCLAEVKEPGDRVDLVAGLVPEGYPTVLYGDGGQGKSQLALTLAISVAVGYPFLGYSVRSTGVLLLDWELDEEEMARRAYRISRGLGLERPPNHLWYHRAECSLPDLVKSVGKFLQERNVGLIVIDSLGPAAGGDPELARSVIPLLVSLRVWRTTALVIDHQAKLQEGQHYERKTPFGSVYKYNLARSVLQVQRVDGKPGQLDLLLRQTKFNFGPLNEPIPLRLSFEGNAVKLIRVDPKSDPSFIEHLNTGDRTLLSLKEDGSGTAQALAGRTGLPQGTITNVLTKLRKQGRVQVVGKEKQAPIYDLANSTSPQLVYNSGAVEKASFLCPDCELMEMKRENGRSLCPGCGWQEPPPPGAVG